jgi:hypothetical protein
MSAYEQQWAQWQRLMANSAETTRALIYARAANDTAAAVAAGRVEVAAAADQLAEMALAHNLDAAWAEETVGTAFGRIDAIRVELEREKTKANGATVRFVSKPEFLAGFIPPDYLIDGMLQRRFVYAMTGQTGHAKTAIALRVAELVSCADYAVLGDHRVEKGHVIYFVGENPDDVRMRVIGANSRRNDDAMKDTITFIPGVFNIAQLYATIAGHAQQIGGCDLVVIDTSAAYFLGDEEMSNTQMGNHARLLRRLTELPGAPCVLVLCHPVKHVVEPSQLLPRGGGAFLAEMDGNLTVWKHEDMIELHHGKMRGPGFEPMNFRLETIRTPRLVDAKGRELPTVQAVTITRSEEDSQTAKVVEDEDKVMAVLLSDPEASLADIAEACGWRNDRGELLRARVQRVISRLEKSKPAQVRKNRNKWELTEDGKANARKAVLLQRSRDYAAQDEERVL